jgi:hypothetical protein
MEGRKKIIEKKGCELCGSEDNLVNLIYHDPNPFKLKIKSSLLSRIIYFITFGRFGSLYENHEMMILCNSCHKSLHHY